MNRDQSSEITHEHKNTDENDVEKNLPEVEATAANILVKPETTDKAEKAKTRKKRADKKVTLKKPILRGKGEKIIRAKKMEPVVSEAKEIVLPANGIFLIGACFNV
jgi:hypothetical protein